MNKQLNKGIIVAGVIALLFIWVCLAFNNFDWAVLYAWILIGGGILVLVAVNVIILCAKNGENEMFEPKITKQEMTEFIKDRGLIMSWEDINSLKNTSNCSPVDLNEIANSLENMGYKVDGTEDGFINFNDGYDRYRLYSAWLHRYQVNCIGICKTYTIEQEDVEEISKIAVEITDSIRIAKLHVFSYDDKIRYGLRVSADSFYSDSNSLNATILALMDFIEETMSRLRERMPRQREDDSTIDFNDVQQQMTFNQNKKTKYEC